MRDFQHQGLGAPSLCGLALNTGRNSLILRGHDVPVWFRAPCRRRDLVAETLDCKRALGRLHDIGFIRRDVLHEVLADPLEGQCDVSLAIWLDFGRRGRRRVVLPVGERLTAVRRSGRDINKTLHLRMVAGLCNDSPPPRVTDEENRTFLHPNDPVGSRNIIRQRAERILNGDRFQSTLREQRNDLCPTRTVRESAMHKNDGLYGHDDYSLLRLFQDMPTSVAVGNIACGSAATPPP